MDLAKRGLILVLFTAVISGFSVFINSFGVKEFDSSVFTFSKNILVALLLFSIIIGLGKINELKSLKRKHWLQLTAIGLIGGSIPFLLFFKGLQMTTGTTSAFIHKTIFVYVTVFALLFLKEKLTKTLFIGAGLLLLGNYFMIKPDFNFSAGHILIFIATIFWAVENTYAKHVLKEISGTIVAFGRMFFGSLFIFMFLLATSKISLINKLTVNHYFWIIISSIFLLLYVFSYYNGLKHIKVTTAACILSLGAPVTTLLSFIFKGMPITIYQSFGILLIILGIVSLVWLTQIISLIAKRVGARSDEWS